MRKNYRGDRSIREQLRSLQFSIEPDSPDGTFGRGQIYYMKGKSNASGSEQKGYRPVVIVSTDGWNCSSNTVEIVPLTTKDKHAMPTHVPVSSTKNPSTALCEQIQSVNKGTLFLYSGDVSEDEMQQINRALMVSIGLAGSKLKEPGDGTRKAIRRGEIYAMAGAGKPWEEAVTVISNDVGNCFSTIVEAVPIIAEALEGSPAYIPIRVLDTQFTVKCGEIQTIDKCRLGKRLGTMRANGIRKVNHAAASVLGLFIEGGEGCGTNNMAENRASA